MTNPVVAVIYVFVSSLCTLPQAAADPLVKTEQ
jgi:hypothetical protein